MSLTSCSRVSIKGKNSFNHVRGNQVNGTINARTVNFNTGQTEVKHTKYDQFREVILGDVFLEKELHSSDEDWKWRRGRRGRWYATRRKAQRTIYTVEIVDRKTKFTAITYEGKDARRVWEEDFEQYSRTKNLSSFQLFGINQSSIPMLIFHNELTPLGHFYKLSFWSSVYLTYLVENNGWGYANVWMDARGSLCSGPDGPHVDWYHFNTDGSLVVPSKAEMLKDNISFQFFREIRSSVDDSVLQCAWGSWENTYLNNLFPGTAEDLQSKNPNNPAWNSAMYPYLHGLWRDPPHHIPMNVIGGLRFDTVYSLSMEAVARWPKGAGSLWEYKWFERRGLVDKTVLDGGLTRFTLDLTQGENVILSTAYSLEFLHAWLSQSSWVFGALNVTEGEENFFIIDPPWLEIESTLHEYDGLTAFFNLCDGKPPVEETPPAPSPIYLFLHPFPESILEFMSWRRQPYFLSFDETGQSEMSEEECERWGVPVLTCRMCWDFKVWKWPTYVCTALREWQEARDFDPTTSDWARSMGCPELEIVGVGKDHGRFEEVDVQEEKTSGSWWEAFAGSGISAFGI
ncbi:hypothetical protein Moror_17054 [Moniliophthora roreri MCA 2997]|uniref:Uncharacterized protein n=2 Tax=Moniliophthora roreri TaxID=221103 RepID=V2YAY0_MONRO|nr:hypothetical protein Moror_17054 [Moniliophthora roreri MCA 2997]KAI3605452.1 hypothetical protein WG66_005967 [Moniliophthora roreri]